MFRASLRDRFLPIGKGWIHDEWITLIVAAFSELRPIDQPLIRYRVHGSQQVGFRNKLEQRAQGTPLRRGIGAGWQSRSKNWNKYVTHCRQWPWTKGGPALPAYQEHLQFLSFRARLPASRLARLGPILTRYSQYGVHASGLPSALKDLILKRSR